MHVGMHFIGGHLIAGSSDSLSANCLPLLYVSHTRSEIVLSYLCLYSIGASSPAMPVNVRISRESLLHNRSTVQWLVSSITYDQEYYVVQYGLSESNLNMNSSRITSGPNITRVNFLLSVELSDLMVGTKYYYRVTATNSAGTNSSTITSSFNMTSNHEECMAIIRNLNWEISFLIIY